MIRKPHQDRPRTAAHRAIHRGKRSALLGRVADPSLLPKQTHWEFAGSDAPLSKSLRELALLASRAFNTPSPNLTNLQLSYFSSQKSTACSSFLASWHKSILAYSCLCIATMGTPHGNQNMNSEKRSSDALRRSALMAIALRPPRVVHRSRAVGHESRFTRHCPIARAF
jgi:hypothetical protein